MGDQTTVLLVAIGVAMSFFLYRGLTVSRNDADGAAVGPRTGAARAEQTWVPPVGSSASTWSYGLDDECRVTAVGDVGLHLGAQVPDDLLGSIGATVGSVMRETVVPTVDVVEAVHQQQVIASIAEPTATDMFSTATLGVEQPTVLTPGYVLDAVPWHVDEAINADVIPLSEDWDTFAYGTNPVLATAVGLGGVTIDATSPMLATVLITDIAPTTLGDTGAGPDPCETEKDAALRAERNRPVTPTELASRQRDFERIVCWLLVAGERTSVPLTTVHARLGDGWSLPMTLLHAQIAARAGHVTIRTPDPSRWTEQLALTDLGRTVLAARMSLPPDLEG